MANGILSKQQKKGKITFKKKEEDTPQKKPSMFSNLINALKSAIIPTEYVGEPTPQLPPAGIIPPNEMIYTPETDDRPRPNFFLSNREFNTRPGAARQYPSLYGRDIHLPYENEEMRRRKR